MVCLSCIAIFGFLITLIAKFLGEFLGISYFKSKGGVHDPEERDVHDYKKEQAKCPFKASGKNATNEEEEDDNPFAKKSAFESGDMGKCPFSAVAQNEAKKRE